MIKKDDTQLTLLIEKETPVRTFGTRCERCHASVNTKKAIEEDGKYFCNASCLEDNTQLWVSHVGGRDPIRYYGDTN